MKISNKLIKRLIKESILNNLLLERDKLELPDFSSAEFKDIPQTTKDAYAGLGDVAFTTQLHTLTNNDLYLYVDPSGSSRQAYALIDHIANGNGSPSSKKGKIALLGKSKKGDNSDLMQVRGTTSMIVHPGGEMYVRVSPQTFAHGKQDFSDTSKPRELKLTGTSKSGSAPTFFTDMVKNPFTGAEELAYFAIVSTGGSKKIQAVQDNVGFSLTSTKGSGAQMIAMNWILYHLKQGGLNFTDDDFAPGFPRSLGWGQGQGSGSEDVEIMFKRDIGFIPAGYRIQAEVKNNSLGTVSSKQFFDLVIVTSLDFETMITWGYGADYNEAEKNVPKIDPDVYAAAHPTEPTPPDDAHEKVAAGLKRLGFYSKKYQNESINVGELLNLINNELNLNNPLDKQDAVNMLDGGLMHTNYNPLIKGLSGLGSTPNSLRTGKDFSSAYEATVQDEKPIPGGVEIKEQKFTREDIAKYLFKVTDESGRKIIQIHDGVERIYPKTWEDIFTFILVLQQSRVNEKSAWSYFRSEFQAITMMPSLTKYSTKYAKGSSKLKGVKPEDLFQVTPDKFIRKKYDHDDRQYVKKAIADQWNKYCLKNYEEYLKVATLEFSYTPLSEPPKTNRKANDPIPAELTITKSFLKMHYAMANEPGSGHTNAKALAMSINNFLNAKDANPGERTTPPDISIDTTKVDTKSDDDPFTDPPNTLKDIAPPDTTDTVGDKEPSIEELPESEPPVKSDPELSSSGSVHPRLELKGIPEVGDKLTTADGIKTIAAVGIAQVSKSVRGGREKTFTAYEIMDDDAEIHYYNQTDLKLIQNALHLKSLSENRSIQISRSQIRNLIRSIL